MLPFYFWTVYPSVLGQLISSSFGHYKTSLTVIILNGVTKRKFMLDI